MSQSPRLVWGAVCQAAFSASRCLSLLEGNSGSLVMLVLIEASAKPNVVAIRSKAGPVYLRPNLACKLVSGGARSSQPSCPRSSGAGTKAAGPNLCNGVEPEPGAAHCHLGAVRKRRWSLSSSSRLFWRFGRHCAPRREATQRAASRAPTGTSPVSARRHNAITSLRMSATIRTFFIRPLAPERRALNHCASALSG